MTATQYRFSVNVKGGAQRVEMEFRFGSSASDWFRFLAAILAVWRVTHLLVRENGPWNLLARLRGSLGGFWADLAGCFKCMSVWVALPSAFFVGGSPLEMLVIWLALSGAAILLELQTPEPLIVESGGEHELLRPERSGTPRPAPEGD